MNRSAVLTLMAFSVSVFAQTSPDAGEQRSIDQLRAIAEAIKSCIPAPMPSQIDMQGFTSVSGPPKNVVWNVELRPSIRGRYVGTIEFAEPSSLKPPPEDEICNKKEGHISYCRHMWAISMQVYENQVEHPLRFRYEFDVTDNGLAFLRAFKKTKQTDDEPWVDGDIESDGCASKAINSVFDLPMVPVKTDHPSGISEEIWSAATHGDPDAQLIIGIMYARGTLVPQDYIEAYFWLDLAASGKTETMKPEDVAKLRDDVASHLTNTIILQTQERARRWFEKHATPTNR